LGIFPSVMSAVKSTAPPLLPAHLSLQETGADVKPTLPAWRPSASAPPGNCFPSPLMTHSALLIGGTGPTGPPIALGLAARGYEVTILHSGGHEIPEVHHLRHLHGDVFSEEGLRAVLTSGTFDLAGGEPLVLDLAHNIVRDFAVANVRTGDAGLELSESEFEFEELAALRPIDVVGGFRCSVAFSITGAEIRPA
jgi:hypothetical protein